MGVTFSSNVRKSLDPFRNPTVSYPPIPAIGRVKDVASRAGAAGPGYIRRKSNARTALTGGELTYTLARRALRLSSTARVMQKYYTSLLKGINPL